MAIKNMLHLSKVDAFCDYLEDNDWCRVDNKGDYEILRMIKPGEQPIIIYGRNGGDHASFEDKHFPIVSKFIRENRKKEKLAWELSNQTAS